MVVGLTQARPVGRSVHPRMLRLLAWAISNVDFSRVVQFIHALTWYRWVHPWSLGSQACDFSGSLGLSRFVGSTRARCGGRRVHPGLFRSGCWVHPGKLCSLLYARGDF